MTHDMCLRRSSAVSRSMPPNPTRMVIPHSRLQWYTYANPNHCVVALLRNVSRLTCKQHASEHRLAVTAAVIRKHHVLLQSLPTTIGHGYRKQHNPPIQATRQQHFLFKSIISLILESISFESGNYVSIPGASRKLVCSRIKNYGFNPEACNKLMVPAATSTCVLPRPSAL